MVQINLGVSF